MENDFTLMVEQLEIDLSHATEREAYYRRKGDSNTANYWWGHKTALFRLQEVLQTKKLLP